MCRADLQMKGVGRLANLVGMEEVLFEDHNEDRALYDKRSEIYSLTISHPLWVILTANFRISQDSDDAAIRLWMHC